MAYDYSGLAKTATRLIGNFGRTIQVLTRQTGGEPWAPVVSWLSADAKALSTSLDKREIDGKLILATDIALLVESGADITTENRIRDGNKDFSIVQCNPLMPGDTVMFYKLIARK